MADHQQMPDVRLPSTSGEIVNPSQVSGWAVYVIYPYTGRPGIPDPPGWDDIPGAHGSTPQALAYSKCYEQFVKQNIRIYGVSFQDTAWQMEFVARTALAYPLLSDAEKSMCTMLKLETFAAGLSSFLKRRTLLVCDGIICHDRTNVVPPEADAQAVLAWFKEQAL